jgi:uncharacterized protein YbjT (DUF2867 family)
VIEGIDTVKRVLVAGATGYLGGFVARELKSRGYFVRALVRSPEKVKSLRSIADEIFIGEVTDLQSLNSLCDGIEILFSSIGITRQKDGLTFRDVDYQGNKNLLDLAVEAGVARFIYTSVFNGLKLRHLEIIAAHEDFVDDLKRSGINYCVLRPTGFFSDMGEFLSMAGKGRIYLIGNGRNRVNPIHGADLAEICVDAIENNQNEINAGGPEIITYREIAELAFQVIGTTPRITCVPHRLLKIVIPVLKVFSRHQADLLAFFTTAATSDAVAPARGRRKLGDYFRELVSASRNR